VKNPRNSTEAADRELESKVMILPKSCESTLQRDKKAPMVEFEISGYSKPYYLDTGVGIGFQYAGLMNILRSHLDTRLQISTQILNEWRRLCVRNGTEAVVNTASELLDKNWNYVDSQKIPYFEIKEIQSWIMEQELSELSEDSLGEAEVIYLAKINGGIVISNDARALEIANELGIICGHQGHLLRQLVYYRLIGASEAFEKFMQMCWISGVKFSLKRKIKRKWFYEASV
jgi:hypothetical protein